MANVKMCDRCKAFFVEQTAGSSHITSGVVYMKGEPNRNLQGDMCADCTSEFLFASMSGIHLTAEAITDREGE